MPERSHDTSERIRPATASQTFEVATPPSNAGSQDLVGGAAEGGGEPAGTATANSTAPPTEAANGSGCIRMYDDDQPHPAAEDQAAPAARPVGRSSRRGHRATSERYGRAASDLHRTQSGAGDVGRVGLRLRRIRRCDDARHDRRARRGSPPTRPTCPHSLEPYPEESLFTLLQNAAAGFPDRPGARVLRRAT